jgi:hypothetical protein
LSAVVGGEKAERNITGNFGVQREVFSNGPLIKDTRKLTTLNP